MIKKLINITSTGYVDIFATFAPAGPLRASDDEIKWLKENGFKYKIAPECVSTVKSELFVKREPMVVNPMFATMYANFDKGVITAKIDKPEHTYTGGTENETIEVRTELVLHKGDKALVIKELVVGEELVLPVKKTGKYIIHIQSFAKDERVESGEVATILLTEEIEKIATGGAGSNG